MTPRIHLLTLAIADLERSLAFYRDGLGLPANAIVGREFEHGAVVFVKLAGGLTLALYPAASLAHEANVTRLVNHTGAIAIGHIVPSKADVDAIITRAVSAGAVVTDPPHDRFWGGYSGHFTDPDGHLWEIAWNPGWSD